MVSDALTIVEITGLLLSLIFVGIQILMRDMGSERLSPDALSILSESLPVATIALYGAALFAIIRALIVSDSLIFGVSLAFINGALASIAYAVTKAAMDLDIEP